MLSDLIPKAQLAPDAQCRLSARTDAEGSFVEAAERDRCRAVAALERLLPGWDLARSLTLLGNATAVALSVDLDSLGLRGAATALDSYVARGDLRSWRASLVNPDDGQPEEIPVGLRIMDTAPDPVAHGNPVALARHLRQGRTVVLNQSEGEIGPTCGRLADLIATAFRAPTQVNSYLSCGVAPGFGLHWDDHDVVVVQVAGRKFWELSNPGALGPIRIVTPDHLAGDVVWSGVLEEGWVLYIPRGWPHRVNGFTDEPSVHLTFSIRRTNVLDVLASVPPSSYVRGRISRADLEHSLGFFRSQMTAFPTVGPVETLLRVIDDFRDAHLRARFLGGAIFDDSLCSESTVAIVANRQALCLPRELLPAVTALLDGSSSVEQLCDALPIGRDDAIRLIGHLADFGVLEVAAGEDGP